MDHSWRPPAHPIQGNICPTCSTSHFPFCPPTPFPNRYPGHNFDPNRGPMNMPHPAYPPPVDPYCDPGHWNRNPSLPPTGDFGNANRGPYSATNHGYGYGGYVGGSEYDVNDRSSKRLRVDGMPYGGDNDANPTSFPWNDNERRLKLVRDHGGPNAFAEGNRYASGGYGPENPGFDRNFDGREPAYASNLGSRNTPDTSYGVNYQKEELGYQSGYGSHHGIKRSVSDAEHGYMGNKIQNHEQDQPLYGNAARPPDNQLHGYHPPSNYGSPHVSKEDFYGNKFQPVPENASGQYEQRSNMPASAHHYEQRSNMPISTNHSTPFPDTFQQPGQMGYGYHSPGHFNDVRQPVESAPRPLEGYQSPFGNQSAPMQPHYGPVHTDNQVRHGNRVSGSMNHWQPSPGFDVRPPLPDSPPPPPPPPLPMDPLGHWSAERKPPSPPRVSSSLFPISVSSAVAVQSSYAPATESHVPTHTHHPLPPRGLFRGDSQGTFASPGHYHREGQSFQSKNNLPEKSQIIDASQLFKPPHRTTRPDHFVIILRGLPGSGKSYLAKMLRDLEVEHGGNAPRIHSMDDYFMTEVEKAEENDTSKSSVRGKKTTVKKVLEYCYEPEMEEAYRSSMLKAFKKTLEEGVFTFVIVDDRNLRVADFAQFWATAKRSGYEVYILEAPYKDPAGCTARNVHGFTHEDVEKMAAQWEEAPSLYLQLDVKSLFHGDDLKESNIQEVDMDTEDGDFDGNVSNLEEREHENAVRSSGGDLRPGELPQDEGNSDAEGDTNIEVKDLGRSKWLDDVDEEDNKRTELLKGKSNVLSGLLSTYGKQGKSVRWGDQGGHSGFSIGAVKKANMVSLVIGPGAGYNLKTNPLPEEEAQAGGKSGEMKKHSVFKERLRAEQESFRAVFDNKRRQRIGGLHADED